MTPEPTPAPIANALTGITPTVVQKPGNVVVTVGSAQTVVSPAFSFKGWLFGTWFQENKGKLKIILTALCAYLAYLLLPVNPPELKAVLIAVISFIEKFGVDVLDYYIAKKYAPQLVVKTQ